MRAGGAKPQAKHAGLVSPIALPMRDKVATIYVKYKYNGKGYKG